MPKLIANGRFNDFVALIQKDLGKDGEKIFKSNLGQVFKLSEWKKALEMSSKPNVGKLFFKMS